MTFASVFTGRLNCSLIIIGNLFFQGFGFGSSTDTANFQSKSSSQAILLFGIGMHIEPQGETLQGYHSRKGDYFDPVYFKQHTGYIEKVVNIINSHGGKVTIQAQSPYTEIVIESNISILETLAKNGNEIALHFHEDAHLGKISAELPVSQWCNVMKEEIALVKQASGVDRINYWSGGNLFPGIFEAADCAGLSINSDWKNPQTQTTDSSLEGVNPWRPSGGTDGTDFSRLITHNPNGPIVFLPEGNINRFKTMNNKEKGSPEENDAAFFQYLEEKLKDSLAEAEAGEVNVFHFTIHPGEYRGDPDKQFDVIDRFLTTVVDPLVADGKIKWATFSEMSDAYIAWETKHPGKDMR